MRGRAANDNAPAEPAAGQRGVQDASAEIVTSLCADRRFDRTEGTSERRRDPRRDNDNLCYDDLLGMVRAEMAWPSA